MIPLSHGDEKQITVLACIQRRRPLAGSRHGQRKEQSRHPKDPPASSTVDVHNARRVWQRDMTAPVKSCALSPDGKWIAYTGGASHDVYVTRLADKQTFTMEGGKPDRTGVAGRCRRAAIKRCSRPPPAPLGDSSTGRVDGPPAARPSAGGRFRRPLRGGWKALVRPGRTANHAVARRLHTEHRPQSVRAWSTHHAARLLLASCRTTRAARTRSLSARKDATASSSIRFPLASIRPAAASAIFRAPLRRSDFAGRVG